MICFIFLQFNTSLPQTLPSPCGGDRWHCVHPRSWPHKPPCATAAVRWVLVLVAKLTHKASQNDWGNKLRGKTRQYTQCHYNRATSELMLRSGLLVSQLPQQDILLIQLPSILLILYQVWDTLKKQQLKSANHLISRSHPHHLGLLPAEGWSMSYHILERKHLPPGNQSRRFINR